jgi:eukaryotic-like serine/threonine-protein kinase
MAASADRRLIAGRYALGAALGRGGMGVVWRAEDVLLDRPVAVKEVELPAGLPDHEQAAVRDRALREARAAARLNHPSVVTLHDVVEAAGRLFLVMELVDAPTLRDLVARDGPLTPAAAARIGLDLLAALAAAHRSGIVHHDVKPANVMVPTGAAAKLADFGIASLEDTQRTLTGAAFGSLPYVAPEQAMGRRGGPPADLWGLGATLWFAVEGAPPFDRGGPAPTLAAILHDPPGDPRRGGPLAPVLLALLGKDPEGRPTAPLLHRLLEPLAGAVPGPTVPLQATARLPADGPGWRSPGGSGSRSASPAAPTEVLALSAGSHPPDAGPGWDPPPLPPAWSRPLPPGPSPPPARGRAAPGPPRRRRRWGRRLLDGVALLAVLLLLANALGDRDRSAGQDRPAGRAGAAATPGIREPARDGQFEFVVRSVRCGLRRVGPELSRQTPQGRFCLVAVSVANVGTEARDFAAGQQRLFGADGRRHSVDAAATAANGSVRLLHSLVNPGNRIEGTLVYDVPPRTRPARMELHDSPFSHGVTVDFR